MNYRHALLLGFFITTTLTAQLPPIGQPFALANTRYGTTKGSSPVLRSNGRDAFLFWEDGKVRVTRIGQNNNAPGVPVFDFANYDRDSFDAVWTGTHFLVAGIIFIDGQYRLYGRIVDASGAPAGDAFPITALQKTGRWPRLAFNGKYVLLVMEEDDMVKAVALTPDGASAGFAAQKFARTAFQRPSLVASNGDRFAVITNETDQLLSMFDANGQFISAQLLTGAQSERPALASDGRRFLAVEGRDTALHAILIQPDGSFTGETQLDAVPYPVLEPGVTWNGSRWVIGYKNNVGTLMTVVETDADARSITSRRTTGGVTKPAIVAVGPRVVTSWVDNDSGLIVAAELPALAGAPVSFSAKNQQLLATVTSSSATLVLWRESGDQRTSIRAGIRTRDGRWREREIGPDATSAIAASDGRDFLVVLDGTLLPLDEELRGDPGTRITAFTPEVISWNGRDYAVLGVQTGTAMIVRVSPAGSISPAVELPNYFNTAVATPRMASDGAGWLVVWPIKYTCSILQPPQPCHPNELIGIHLDADLQIIDPAPLTVGAGKDIAGFDVAWSGTQYVVAWSSPTGVAAMRVGTQETTLISSMSGTTVSVAGVAGGTVIGWTTQHLTTPRYEARVALLSDPAAPAIVYQGDDNLTLRVASLPAGDLAILRSSWQKDAPLHGTNHVMMAIGAFGLPSLSDAPSASLRQDGNTLILGWGRPPQRINGYRVESRLNDGPWTEVDRWFDPEERTYTTSVPAGASIAFRVRAWNDSGTGAYSQAVVANTNRTRSARH